MSFNVKFNIGPTFKRILFSVTSGLAVTKRSWKLDKRF